jgi:hypothetical protein
MMETIAKFLDVVIEGVESVDEKAHEALAYLKALRERLAPPLMGSEAGASSAYGSASPTVQERCDEDCTNLKEIASSLE